METAAFIAALLALGGAVAAVSLRNLIHCALCLVLTYFSVAVLYLLLGAEFVAFAQVMVYVGAIAMLIVFATLLTRSAGMPPEPLAFQPWLLGVGIAGAVTGAIIACVLASRWLPSGTAEVTPLTVRRLGEELMTTYVVPLEVVGLLLTAAMIGAVVLALREPGKSPWPRGQAQWPRTERAADVAVRAPVHGEHPGPGGHARGPQTLQAGSRQQHDHGQAGSLRHNGHGELADGRGS